MSLNMGNTVNKNIFKDTGQSMTGCTALNTLCNGYPLNTLYEGYVFYTKNKFKWLSKNNKNDTGLITEDGYNINENNKCKQQQIIEMANFVHDPYNSSYETAITNTHVLTPMNSSNKKRNPLVIQDATEPIQSLRKNNKNGKHPPRQRLYTYSFDTAQTENIHTLPSLTTEDDGTTIKSSNDIDQFEYDNEMNVDTIKFVFPLIASQLPSHWIQAKYMKVLPDDEEQNVSDEEQNVFTIKNANISNAFRRYSDLQVRRDSEDIDYNKLNVNPWGTSLSLHESGLIEGKEELNKHQFFYHAPKVKKKRKKAKFKHRIKEDANLNKELEDDIINQMITDLEVSSCATI